MSGIYIQDMEIPKVGRILIVFPSGRVLEVSADETQDIFKEAQAFPVPPHGSLIDEEALYDRFYEDYFRFAAETIVDYIRTNAPTITEEEAENHES